MGSLAVLVAVGIVFASLVSLNCAAVGGLKPAFDWTQFVKGVKRAAETEVAVPDTQELDIDYQDSQFQIKPAVSNPSSLVQSTKPFLSTKPTFMPPAVDPQYFIDKKTALLDGLFSGPLMFGGAATAPNYFAGKKTAFLSALFSQLATTPQPTDKNATKPERRLIAPWLTTPPPPPFDPKVMADKKTAFLDKLFSSFDATTVKPTIVPPGFWMPPPPKLAMKPTIVPPDFWLPFPALKAAVSVPPKPIVDPSAFVDKKTKFMNVPMDKLGMPAPAPAPDKVFDLLDALVQALLIPASEAERSVRAAPTPAPKDELVDTFVDALTAIKNEMVETASEMLDKAATVPGPKKKAGSPFWGSIAPDPTTPYREKMGVLDRAFEALTTLRKDAVAAVDRAALTIAPDVNASTPTILDLLHEKLSEAAGPRARSIKVAVRQGYQSLPHGATELLQAGGGRSPQGNEGGGLTLQMIAPA